MRQLVDEIFADCPPVHQGETGTDRAIAPGESLPPPEEPARLARHTAVTPGASEAEGIKKYARSRRIAMRNVRFALAAPEGCLPRAGRSPLDLVPINGKHAHPWPVLDWFYTADRLRQGGLVMAGDCARPGVAQRKDFLDAGAAGSPWPTSATRPWSSAGPRPPEREVAWNMHWLKPV